jgi:gamma-glutamylcyclotransferase (GGCT)/AIG2-like uncharacterized protein YtfP
MTNAQWLGEFQLEGYQLYDMGHYPAAISGEGTVHCEVYRINASILAELDELKSNTKDYKRELIQTPYGSAWLYLYKHSIENFPLIESGNWLDRFDKEQ